MKTYFLVCVYSAADETNVLENMPLLMKLLLEDKKHTDWY